MTEDSQIPTVRRRGWRLLAVLVLGMVLLGLGGGIWWYYADGDLEVVREQARQQGRPLEWSEMKLTLASAERMQTWNRIVAVAGRLKSFQSQLDGSGKSRYKPWDPNSDEMRAHHAAIDSSVITELTTLLDHLGDEPLVLHDQMTYTTTMPEIGVVRALVRFMQERLILADKADVGVWARRLLAMCRRIPANSFLLYLVRASCLDITVGGIAVRLSDLKQTDPAVAADLLATIGTQDDDLLHALDGEFLMMIDVLARRRMDGAFPDGESDWFRQLVTRAGRQGALRAQLDVTQQLRALEANKQMAWARAVDADFNLAAKKGGLNPSLILQGLFMPSWSVVISQGQLTELRARVIAAELQGTPWPIDLFDPKGGPLRPLQRDGRTIAAYSVHLDGLDQGGDAKLDRIIPLYADPTKPEP